MTVEALLDGIERANIALADFQRDFDWSGPAIRSLLATVLMGWPAGSLLAVAGDHPELSVRRFEGGPAPRAPLDLIILDGQQRLTALLHAVRGRGSQRFFVPLAALESGLVDDIEDGLRHLAGGDPAEALFVDPAHVVIPLASARNQPAFLEWRKRVVAKAPEGDQKSLDLRLAQVYRDHLHWLHDHEFALVTLDQSVDSAAVARIFERVNRSGLRLGSFDLVVARAYSHDWNLRDRWEEARFAFPLLDLFYGDDGLAALQTISLRESGDVRQAAVLELSAPTVLAEWDNAVKALNDAIRFLASECGVLRAEWLPYRAFVLLLSALARDGLLHGEPELLRNYVLTRSFGLRFDAAANTRVVEDYRRLSNGAGGNDEPPPASERLILGSTRNRQGAIYRAFACLLALRGAKDLAGRPMTLDEFAPSGDTPITPDAAVTVSMVPRDSDERLHLRTMGVVLANPTTALEIKQSIASTAARSAVAFRPLPNALDSQLVSADSAANTVAEPAIFLRERLGLLSEELGQRFGQRVIQ